MVTTHLDLLERLTEALRMNRAHALAILIGLVGAAPAYGVECGDTLGPGGTYALTDDLDCEFTATGGNLGLTLLSGVTLNMRGHALTCTFVGPCPAGVCPGQVGISVGESALGAEGVVLKDGTVSGCTVAVAGGGSRIVVKDIVAEGPGQNGFFFAFADDSVFKRNSATGFEFAGFTIAGLTGGNTVTRNDASENGVGFDIGLSSTFGRGNQVHRNTASDNVIGFRVGGQGDRLVGNEATHNSEEGIAVRGVENSLIRNTAFCNGESSNTFFDLVDENADCDANVWRQNEFCFRNAECIE